MENNDLDIKDIFDNLGEEEYNLEKMDNVSPMIHYHDSVVSLDDAMEIVNKNSYSQFRTTVLCHGFLGCDPEEPIIAELESVPVIDLMINNFLPNTVHGNITVQTFDQKNEGIILTSRFEVDKENRTVTFEKSFMMILIEAAPVALSYYSVVFDGSEVSRIDNQDFDRHMGMWVFQRDHFTGVSAKECEEALTVDPVTGEILYQDHNIDFVTTNNIVFDEEQPRIEK